MPVSEELATFVREAAGHDGPLTDATSLQGDLQLYGDDVFEVMEEFSSSFEVDLSPFRWYFHSGEEGFNLGGLFFKPPNERVREIPITLGLLQEAVEHGVWTLEYPEHSLPAYRLDKLLNQVLWIASVLGALGYGAWLLFAR